MGQEWNCKTFDIDGLKLIKLFRREDARGYFVKSYESSIFTQLGIHGNICETFETWSEKAVIRGLHFQLEKPQAKLVRAVQGEIFDVAADLRKGSASFGSCQAVRLNADENMVFYLPAGFAHGFQVISEYALVSYQCIGTYQKETDTGIYYRDEQLGINWPIQESIVSDRDKHLMSLDRFIKEHHALEG